MLDQALAARLPLISVHTEDPYHIKAVIKHYTGWEPTMWSSSGGALPTKESGTVFYTFEAPDELRRIYGHLKKVESSLVLVNPEDVDPMVFNAGEVAVPQKLLLKFLKAHLEGSVEAVASMLRGLSLKEVYEIISISSAMYHELTPKSVSEVRRLHMANRTGLSQVDTSLIFYRKHGYIEDWVAINKWAFNAKDLDKTLIPRGLLLDGPPGTGKTMAAKRIAGALGVPLFNLNLGSLMDKWVGASESNLRTALASIDRAAPCVILIDEVEKVLATSDDSGVGTRMLSTLLWWMQEHTSKVITILTTNDLNSLPPELYRPGRIDEIVSLTDVGLSEAMAFINQLLVHYGNLYPDILKMSLYKQIEKKFYAPSNMDKRYSYAVLTEEVVRSVKYALAGLAKIDVDK